MTDNDITVGQLIGAAATRLAQRSLKEPVATVELATELKRLISVFGAGAVRDAVALATKGKVGRKQEQDWPLLGEVIKQDARDWLDGRNPFKVRSNYAVAVAFAETHPGHNAAATQRRIMGKLAKKRSYLFHITAWEISEREQSFEVYFRVVAQVIPVANARLGKIIQDDADRHLGKLQRYREVIGEPAADMTILQIETDLENMIARRAAAGMLDQPIGRPTIRTGEEMSNR